VQEARTYQVELSSFEKTKKNKYEKSKKALKAETWNDTKCDKNDEEYANIFLMANSELEDEIEVSNFDIAKEVSNCIDELCSDYKATLSKISKLKMENSKPKQNDLLQKEKKNQVS